MVADVSAGCIVARDINNALAEWKLEGVDVDFEVAVNAAE